MGYGGSGVTYQYITTGNITTLGLDLAPMLPSVHVKG